MNRKKQPKVKMCLYLPQEVAESVRMDSILYGWDISAYVSFLIRNSRYYKTKLKLDENTD